jgi:CheY-like chemotaxis protein
VSDFRILLVEDNAPDVLLIKEALEHLGLPYTLQLYTNGEAAAKAISAAVDAPDLFLLDLNVPRLHGLELLRMIRDQPRMAHVPVAILTSSRAAEDRAESEQRGADAYIVKPTSYSDFKAQVGQAVAELLERRSRADCRSSRALAHSRRMSIGHAHKPHRDRESSLLQVSRSGASPAQCSGRSQRLR